MIITNVSLLSIIFYNTCTLIVCYDIDTRVSMKKYHGQVCFYCFVVLVKGYVHYYYWVIIDCENIESDKITHIFLTFRVRLTIVSAGFDNILFITLNLVNSSQARKFHNLYWKCKQIIIPKRFYTPGCIFSCIFILGRFYKVFNGAVFNVANKTKLP